MRPELHRIEQIEKYLTGELEAPELDTFMEELKKDKNLQKEVELQRSIMQGIERLGLIQTVKRAFRKYKLKKNIKLWGIISGAIISVGIVAYLLVNQAGLFSETKILLNEQGDTLWCDADKYLPAQIFHLNLKNDTVIETEGGIVMVIPANAFLDSKGKVVKGAIELECKEALDAYSIMSVGLSTTSDGKPLETGGMFYINARQKGKQLKINPEKFVYAEVPTQEVKSGMQLFDGKRMPDGSINWVDPQPLKNYLLPVDIHSLNFYPPGYEDSLAAWGFDINNKEFKDSLFYTFSCEDLEFESFWNKNTAAFFRELSFGNSQTDEPEIIQVNYIQQNEMDLISEQVAVVADESADTCQVNNSCSWIEPANIKAFWNDKFQNTILATKEFEDRYTVIYQIGSGKILEFYINNLDMPLYKIDSIVLEHVPEKYYKDFREFTKRKDGSVNIKDNLAKKLSEYYQKKSKLYKEAIAKTNRRLREEKKRLDQLANKKQTEKTNKDLIRGHKNYNKEFQLNLDEAYRQLGYKKARNSVIPPARYKASITTLGWKNIDAYVAESTAKRETLNYTSQDNKKVTIRYYDFMLKVNQRDTFDRIYTYLVSDELYSFMRMPESAGYFKESLNELLDYNLICIGYKNEIPYVFALKDIQNRDTLLISLNQTSGEEVKLIIKELTKSKISTDITSELEYEKFMLEDRKRQQKNRKNREFRKRLLPVIFPGYTPPVFYLDDEEPMTDTIYPLIEPVVDLD